MRYCGQFMRFRIEQSDPITEVAYSAPRVLLRAEFQPRKLSPMQSHSRRGGGLTFGSAPNF